MATSQFIIYTSSDVGGPGPLYGNSGSLLAVLDACLVNGYTNKLPAGWTKPFPNSTSYGCYKQPSGSQMAMFVNDNFVANGREAAITGWASLTSMTTSASISSASNVGTGYGQFPLPTQLNTIGKVQWRKSATNDVTNPRPWIIAADAYTMYIWVNAGDGGYAHGVFGDFYSFYGTSDVGRCLLNGRYIENSALATSDYTDCMSLGIWNGTGYLMQQGLQGMYIAKSPGGSISSIVHTKKGDLSTSNGGVNQGPQGTFAAPMVGQIACPNPTDNNFYLTALWVVEPSGSNLRGKYRGLVYPNHAASNFSDGQTIQGSGTFAGKSFMIVKQGYNGGYWAIETSNTVQTN